MLAFIPVDFPGILSYFDGLLYASCPPVIFFYYHLVMLCKSYDKKDVWMHVQPESPSEI